MGKILIGIIAVSCVLIYLHFSNQQPSQTATIANSSNSPIVNQSYNVSMKNDSINIGENSGNVAQLNNSPNASVIQNISNPAAKPYFIKTNLLSINIPEFAFQKNPIYRTEFSLDYESYFPFKGYRIAFDTPASNISSPETRFHNVDHLTVNGILYSGTITVTFLTSQKVQESDFGFSFVNDP